MFRTFSRTAIALALASGPLLAQEDADGAAEAPESGQPVAQEQAAQASDEAADPEQVVATVNGQPVTLGEVVSVRSDLPDQYQQIPDEALYDGIRQQLVDQKLIAQAAQADGLDDDPAVSRALAIQRQGILAQFYMQRVAEEAATDEALREAYDSRIGDAPAVTEVRASHILVEDEALATDLRAQIEDGADFAELAIEHGTDGTRTQGGDLGYFTRDVMVPAFADAAFAMEVGDVSEPVQTQFGWHLIQLTDRREQPKPTFEEAAEELRASLGSDAVNAALTSLREAATVEVDEARPGLGSLRDDAVSQR